MSEPTCRVNITDETLPMGAAVAVHDRYGREFVILVDRASLLDDPEGVMMELGRHMDATMSSYSRALRRVPTLRPADYVAPVSDVAGI